MRPSLIFRAATRSNLAAPSPDLTPRESSDPTGMAAVETKVLTFDCDFAASAAEMSDGSAEVFRQLSRAARTARCEILLRATSGD